MMEIKDFTNNHGPIVPDNRVDEPTPNVYGPSWYDDEEEKKRQRERELIRRMRQEELRRRKSDSSGIR